RPSTVAMAWPSAWLAAIRHAHTGSPSSKTVHAPQSPASQPTLVPVSPRFSRRTRERRCHAGQETVTFCPLTENASETPFWIAVSLVVAIEAVPHTGIQSTSYQGQRSIHAVISRSPDIIDRAERR